MLLRDHVAFHAAALDHCTIDRKHASPGLYSSWITADLRGTFKGVPGSMGW